MPVNKAKKGADFERQTLKELIGYYDKKEKQKVDGIIHDLISAAFPTGLILPPKLYGIRAAGSHGFWDLLVVITFEEGIQCTLGIQCKNHDRKMSFDSMLSSVKCYEKCTGIIGTYAYKQKGKKAAQYWPPIEDVFNRLVDEVI